MTIRNAEIQTEKCFQYFKRLEKIHCKRFVTEQLLVESGNKLRVKERSGSEIRGWGLHRPKNKRKGKKKKIN